MGIPGRQLHAGNCDGLAGERGDDIRRANARGFAARRIPNAVCTDHDVSKVEHHQRIRQCGDSCCCADTGEIDQALGILGMNPNDVRCAYCGDPATEWDHLRPLVLKRRPTGFISEIANLVPACGKCNQSKGNKGWRTWIVSAAPLSPAGRKKADVADRITRLEVYERWRSPTKVDVEAIVGSHEWETYWRLCEEIIDDLRASQAVADDIRERVRKAVTKSA